MTEAAAHNPHPVLAAIAGIIVGVVVSFGSEYVVEKILGALIDLKLEKWITPIFMAAFADDSLKAISAFPHSGTIKVGFIGVDLVANFFETYYACRAALWTSRKVSPGSSWLPLQIMFIVVYLITGQLLLVAQKMGIAGTGFVMDLCEVLVALGVTFLFRTLWPYADNRPLPSAA